jgi:hypothetical protein
MPPTLPGTGSADQVRVRDAFMKLTAQEGVRADGILALGDNAYASGTEAEYQWHFFDV